MVDMKEDLLSRIPLDLQGYILSFVSLKTVEFKISILNKEWNAITKDSRICAFRTKLFLLRFENCYDYETCSFINVYEFKQREMVYMDVATKKYTNIHSVVVGNTLLLDENNILIILKNCKKLKTIRFNNYNYDTILLTLKNCSTLELLILKNPYIGTSEFIELLEYCTTLKQLQINKSLLNNPKIRALVKNKLPNCKVEITNDLVKKKPPMT
jgi:hypothetical protein